MRKALVVSSAVVLAAALAGAVAIAQPQQVVTPPKAVYWVSADTTGGLGAMAGVSMSQMMSGNIPTQAKTLKLELGSTLTPTSGAPNAAHDIPPALQMGRALDLRTPTRAAPVSTEREPGQDPSRQEIKGRLILFWGCGEHAGPGQPLIVDFAGLQRGQMPAGLTGASVNIAPERGPSVETSRTFGEWPNSESHARRGANAVPANGSLVGDHFIHGNYSPDIRFSLGADRDFLAGVRMTQTKAASGSVAMSWAVIPNATGYFASIFGGMQGQNGAGGDMVIWTSSARKLFGGPINSYVSPAEAGRLVGERVFLAPSATTCTVPQEVTHAAPQGAMLMFSAFGPEANFVYPPRPADVRTPWNQEWVAKVRFKSGMMAMLGQNGTGVGAMMGGTPEQQAEQQRALCEQRRQQQGAMSGGVGGAIGSATGIPGAGMLGGALGHAFGKGKQKDQPADPNCPTN